MQQGFDNRIVSYEYIHSISPEDFSILIDTIDPQENEFILDAMCGYGAVGKAILQREPKTNLFLLDESDVQIKRAIQNVQAINRNRFINSSLPNDNFTPGFFDKIVIKMGLHEVSLQEHLSILKEFKRILKPDGKLIVWDIMLTDETQSVFQSIIRKKDELAGFDLLTAERYFFREDEFLFNAKTSGFSKVREVHKIDYRFSSKKRLHSEFGDNVELLEKLNDFIRKSIPSNLRDKMNFSDKDNDIQFNIVKKIFVLEIS